MIKLGGDGDKIKRSLDTRYIGVYEAVKYFYTYPMHVEKSNIFELHFHLLSLYCIVNNAIEDTTTEGEDS